MAQEIWKISSTVKLAEGSSWNSANLNKLRNGQELSGYMAGTVNITPNGQETTAEKSELSKNFKHYNINSIILELTVKHNGVSSSFFRGRPVFSSDFPNNRFNFADLTQDGSTKIKNETKSQSLNFTSSPNYAQTVQYLKSIISSGSFLSNLLFSQAIDGAGLLLVYKYQLLKFQFVFNYTPKNYTITTKVKGKYANTTEYSDNIGGTVTPSATVAFKSSKSFTATPQPGFRFVCWEETGETTPTFTISPVENITRTALFEEIVVTATNINITSVKAISPISSQPDINDTSLINVEIKLQLNPSG